MINKTHSGKASKPSAQASVTGVVLLSSLLSVTAMAKPPQLSTNVSEPDLGIIQVGSQQEINSQETGGQGSSSRKLDKQLTQFSYPYPVDFFRVKLPVAPTVLNGENLPISAASTAEMAYMDVGPRDSTSVVLLLHGKNFSGAYWQSTIEALLNDGHRVIAPDQLGFGKSSKPAHFPWSFQQLALYNAELLDHLGVDEVMAVGHSMGGMLATRFSLMFPERVNRLALVNPIGLEDWKVHVPYQSVAETYQQELKKQPEQIKAYMQKSYFDGKWQEEYNDLVAIQAGWVRGPDWPLMAWVSANHYDMIFNQPVLYEFPNLKMPVLLIIGGRDRTALGKGRAPEAVANKLGRYDELGRITAAAIPNSTLVELPGVGHVPQYEAFARYSRALKKFLQPAK